MKLTVNRVLEVTEVIAKIIRENRPMPLKGAYRLARMHAKLYAEYLPITSRRDALIKAYGYHPILPSGTEGISIESEQFAVPADKMEEYAAAWAEIGNEEIEVDVQQIPLAQLDLGDTVAGSISANELISLGDLVTE